MRKWWQRDRRVYVDLNEGQDAVAALRNAESRWPEVRRLSMELRQHSDANNFRRRFQAEFERNRSDS